MLYKIIKKRGEPKYPIPKKFACPNHRIYFTNRIDSLCPCAIIVLKKENTMKKYQVTHEDDTNDLLVITVTAESEMQALKKALVRIQNLYPTLTMDQIKQDKITVELAEPLFK